MAILATITDVAAYEPDIENYGISDFDGEIVKAQSDVFRDLRIRWWPTQQHGLYDVKYVAGGNVEPDEDLFTASQLTRACVYQALGYHIYPKLSRFEPDVDVFERKMEHYRAEYEREMDLVLRDGVEYDLNNDNTISDNEKTATHHLRLKR